jgi:hypothetical protein
MSSEFMLDDRDNLWLVRTKEVLTTEGERTRAGVDMEVSHMHRTKKNVKIEEKMELEGERVRR